MHRTTSDLVTTFNATSGYTQSDEITLIFSPFVNEENEENQGELLNVSYHGKIQKLVSLTSGYFLFFLNLF